MILMRLQKLLKADFDKDIKLYDFKYKKSPGVKTE